MLLLILLLLSVELIFSLQNWAINSHICRNNKLSILKLTTAVAISTKEETISPAIKFYQTISNPGKPPLVFIPGLDGTGDYSTDSLHNLTKEYDVW